MATTDRRNRSSHLTEELIADTQKHTDRHNHTIAGGVCALNRADSLQVAVTQRHQGLAINSVALLVPHSF